MVQISIIQENDNISFKSEGHFQSKELCGAYSIMIQGLYFCCAQKHSWIIDLIFKDYDKGIIKFKVKNNKKVLTYFEVFLTSSSFINNYYPNTIEIITN